VWGGADLSALDKEKFFEELKALYRKKVLPLELSSRYAQFQSAALQPSDFDAKPMVLLLGQYSVGKTSFIRSLLKRDFPGVWRLLRGRHTLVRACSQPLMNQYPDSSLLVRGVCVVHPCLPSPPGQRVGPEPTTDRFMAVMWGGEERLVPGHALAMQADKPFRGLAGFGNNFLTKFEAAEVRACVHLWTYVCPPCAACGLLCGVSAAYLRLCDRCRHRSSAT
jgi:EH domain-containing protein 3